MFFVEYRWSHQCRLRCHAPVFRVCRKKKKEQSQIYRFEMKKTPSSLPISTPAPSSLSGSSPEFAPLSLVHTNSLNDAKSLNVKPDPTSFNLPPSYTEDNRISNAIASRGLASENSLGDQRNERYGVTTGTLDAIRERMKSMQLAAAVGNPEAGSRPLINKNDNLNHGISSQNR
ncbi:protein MOR1-like [Pistacia vera]|uniref:protein MOR1-like n=1 Tax=Pistacia vera TaxID=55513 RepID=UPI0012637E87|nr:protein MOR1-like [Pistacia vera]